MENYLIGVDIGTQGTKAVLFTTELRPVCSAFETSKLISPEPGVVWQEPEEMYLSCVRTIRSLMEQSQVDPYRVLALGLDGQMAGILGIGKNGEAITYYDSWLDLRSSGYCKQLSAMGHKEIISCSGGPITSNHATKILWWKNEAPDLYHKISKFVLPHTYIANRIVGGTAENAVFDHTCLHFNSFSDNKNRRWNDALLHECGIPREKLPRIVSPLAGMGGVSPAFAEQSGLVNGIPVAVGAGDTAAGSFGAGLLDAGHVLDCAGTASVLCASVDRYIPDTVHETLTMMRSPVDDLWLPLAYINGGGLCIRWFRNTLTGEPHTEYETLEREARHIPAGSEGVLFCPHFSGRILPSQPQMKGSFFGLDFKHTRAHLYRAVLESIAFEYAGYLDILRENHASPDSVICIGGGANSTLFNQVKADVLGLPVRTFDTGETALIGSAVIGGVSAGAIPDYPRLLRSTMQERAVFRPDPANRDPYRTLCGRYQRFLSAAAEYYAHC